MKEIGASLRQLGWLIRQNKLAAAVSIIGTALAIGLILILMIIFLANISPIYPETHRGDTYLFANCLITGKDDGRRVSVNGASLNLVRSCFYPLETSAVTSAFVRNAQSRSFFETLDGRSFFNGIVVATDTAYFQLFEFDFLAGKPFSSEAFSSGLREIILTEEVARALLGRTDIVGQEIEVDFVSYRVCGVVRTVSRFARYAYANAWIPYTTLDGYSRGNFEEIQGNYECLFLLRKGYDRSDLRAEIERNVNRFNASLSDFKVNILSQPYSPLESWLQIDQRAGSLSSVFQEALLILAILFLIPALNLSTVIFSWTRKRIPEIGLRRAYGANRRQIITQVLLENFFLTLAGGLLGLILAYGAIGLLEDWLLVTALGQEKWSVSLVSGWIFLVVFLACLFMNLLSAFLPAWRASRVPITNALNEK